MKILSVDTSATAASVALSEEGKLIGETFINTSLTHSQTLIPMVEQLLNNTKTEISDIDAIAVNAGPGSFTGVRIGVAAVKGLAFANNIPCVSVSTLESMAYNFLSTDCIVCAVMDARCSQVYNALFEIKNGVVTRLCDDRALSLDALKNELLSVDGRIIIAGDGTDITCKYIVVFVYDTSHVRDKFFHPFYEVGMEVGFSTALVAFEMINNGQTVSAQELMPVYLRLPQAQRELNKKLGGRTK